MKKSILQRIMSTDNKKENAEDGKVKKEEQKSERVRNYSGIPGGNWIKIRNNLPRNPIGPIRMNAMKATDRSGHSDPYNIFSPRSPWINIGSSPTRPEMIDLETIICEFEKGFLSPSKHEVSKEVGKQRNFVKKIVAAFEVKYKACNDPNGQDGAGGSSNPDTSCEGAVKKSPIFESIRFNSPSENLCDSMMMIMDERGEFENGSSSNSMGQTFVWTSETKFSDEDGLIDLRKKKYDDETENRENEEISVYPNDFETSTIFRSEFGTDWRNETGEYSDYPLNLKRRDSNDSNYSLNKSFFKFDKEESYQRSNIDPKEAETLDDTMIMDDTMVLDLTMPKQGNTSSMENEFSQASIINYIKQEEIEEEREEREEREEEKEEKEGEEEGSKDAEEISRNKIPKIVGAFLKKPIEVEDTSINWIPIPGKKLPRKRSLKKLLYSLTGKRLDKKRKFSSERNLNEGEYQDSGFDEKSCSSASLSSLASITDILGKTRRENNNLLNMNKDITFETFKSKNLEEEKDKASSLQREENFKKFIFTEVPRETLKIDLGPTYPPLNLVTQTTMKTTQSDESSPTLVAENLTTLPKHPNLSSKIRKHPFISLTKMDNSQEFCNPYVYRTGQHSSVIIKNDMYEVEIRSRGEEIPSPTVSGRSSSSTIVHYDVPRKFLSKSETDIWVKCQCLEKEESIYDIPKVQIIGRSKSSDYENILSLQRKSTIEELNENYENYENGDNTY